MPEVPKLSRSVYEELKKNVSSAGHLYVNFSAKPVLQLDEEAKVAKTILIPALRAASQCLAYPYPSHREHSASLVSQNIILRQGRQYVLNPDLDDITFMSLLVGTRPKRPTLVWSLERSEPPLMSLLNNTFDPVQICNLRIGAASASVPAARRIAEQAPGTITFLLLSNMNLSGCAIFVARERGTEFLDELLNVVKFSDHYIRRYCGQNS